MFLPDAYTSHSEMSLCIRYLGYDAKHVQQTNGSSNGAVLIYSRKGQKSTRLAQFFSRFPRKLPIGILPAIAPHAHFLLSVCIFRHSCLIFALKMINRNKIPTRCSTLNDSSQTEVFTRPAVSLDAPIKNKIELSHLAKFVNRENGKCVLIVTQSKSG